MVTHILRVSFMVVFSLAGCTPSGHDAPGPSQGAIAGPSVVVITAAPDLAGTLAVLQVQMAHGTATAESQAAQMAESRRRAAEAATSTAVERGWLIAQGTATAQSDQATATTQTRQTSTAQAAPALIATQTHIRRVTAQDEQRAEIARKLAPWEQGVMVAAKDLALALLGWAVFAAINHLVPAAADRVRGAAIITVLARELPEPGVKGLLPAPREDNNMVPVSEKGNVLMEFRARDGRVLLGSRDLLLLAWSLRRGTPFSEGSLGRAIPNFREVQDEFLAQGLARWKALDAQGQPVTRQGVVLTEQGRQYLFLAVLHSDQPPSPTEDSPQNDPRHARTYAARMPHARDLAEGEGFP